MYRIELIDNEENALCGQADVGGGILFMEIEKASMLVNDDASHFLHYREAVHPDGLKSLNGMSALDARQLLEEGIDILGTDITEEDSDYPGNCGYVLAQLLNWIEANQLKGHFRVTDEF